jgi:dipeptidyl aminopeptidase/acylaminoacyl peptidase
VVLGISSAALGGLLGVPRLGMANTMGPPLGRGSVSFEPYLRVRAAWGGAFSPDGGRLTFQSNESGSPQVWRLDLETGHVRQRTSHDERVTFASHARGGGQALIFGSDVDGNERTQFYWLSQDDETARPLTRRADAIHTWGGWSPDGQRIAFSANRRDPASFDVYVQEVPDGEARLVLQHDGNNYPVGWAPDGRSLLVSRVTSSRENDLFFLDPVGGELRHLTPHPDRAIYGGIDWTPDGRHVYLVTDRDRDRAALAVLDLADGSLSIVSESAWEVDACNLAPDGRRLAWLTNQDGYSVLHVRDLADGRDVPLAPVPTGVISGLSWARDGRRLAITLSTFDAASDVWLLDVEEPVVRRLTHSSRAGLVPESFVAPEIVRYRSFDGLEIPAFLYLPQEPTSARPLPVLFSVHGGPDDQTRPNFNPIFQYFVQRGYAVFAPNIRGSAGYGKRYAGLDDVERRMDAVADLEAGWRWLVRSSLADPGRVAIVGGSYGGFLVLAALVAHPELWAAGVDIVGIANFATFLETTGPYRRRLRETEYGDLERDAGLLQAISPIHRVDRIRAPLMVIHGANDPRVPVGEAEQIVASLRARGAAVEYLRFEDEGHGLARLENRLTAYPAIADFLDRSLARPG